MRIDLTPGRKSSKKRDGAILVLAAATMVVVFGFLAFTVDTGYITLLKTQLQAAADASALAASAELSHGPAAVRTAAKDVGTANSAGGKPVTLSDSQIELGTFDLTTKAFVVGDSNANAVRVTTRVTDAPLFFAPVIGHKKVTVEAQAISMLNPRDICFVVDLSGSMNDDSEPCWATSVINSTFGPQGYPTVGNELMQDVFDDFGYGTYPGVTEYVGKPLGVASDSYAYAEMTKDNGPLTASTIASAYKIANTDSEATRKTKAYKWMIDKQIAVKMPLAKPTPNSSNATSLNYWTKYLDYLLISQSVGSNPPSSGGGSSGGGSSGGGSSGGGSSGGGGGGGGGPTPPTGWLDRANPTWPFEEFTQLRRSRVRDLGEVAAVGSDFLPQLLLAQGVVGQTTYGKGLPRNGSTLKVTLPPSQDSDRITSFNNPNKNTFPTASSSLASGWRNKIGYVTYVQFMMDWGRDRSPDVSNTTNAATGVGVKTQLSVLSPDCPYHVETTAGGSFDFPPREQPTHACRRSLIAAIKVVKDQNGGVPSTVADRVSIVTFDAVSSYHAPVVAVPLTNDYQAAMQACTKLQALSDIGSSTATEPGLKLARSHMDVPENGGQGRNFTSKVYILLTDGVPNVWTSTATEIGQYVVDNPSPDYYDSAYLWLNAALVQASYIQNGSGRMFPVGMGLGTDYGFMDRMSRMAQTDNGGQSPRGSGNPAEYEQRLTDIFTEIIKNPGSRLVK